MEDTSSSTPAAAVTATDSAPRSDPVPVRIVKDSSSPLLAVIVAVIVFLLVYIAYILRKYEKAALSTLDTADQALALATTYLPQVASDINSAAYDLGQATTGFCTLVSTGLGISVDCTGSS